MSELSRPPFVYHAGALALSGHIKRPLDHLIDVQAGTSLPTTGGHGTARVENFRFNQMISFRAGHSQVSGSEKIEDVRKDGKTEQRITFTTLSTAVVEGLNVLDVVTADRIVARLSSSYVKGEDHEPRILTIGSRLENLRIAGCKVDVHLHDELALKLATFEQAREQYKNNAIFQKMVDDPFGKGDGEAAKIEAHGSIHCSLVRKFDPADYPGMFKYHGHVVDVPEFGKIYLAEVLLQCSRKTLTMLRIELGSPSSGNVTGPQADSNGRLPGGGG